MQSGAGSCILQPMHLDLAQGRFAASVRPEKAVMEPLHRLHEAGRLGVHINENPSGFDWPHYLWQGMGSMAPQDVRRHLATKQHMPLASLSLLPPRNAEGQSNGLRLYSMAPYQPQSFGYVFDLREDTAHPALVMRASAQGIFSGHNMYGKNLRLHDESYASVPGLDIPKDGEPPLYRWFEDDKAWYAAMSKKEGPEFSGLQLDALADMYRCGKGEGRVYPMNELLVAGSMGHAVAIMVPIGDCKGLSSGADAERMYRLNYRLSGALAGLQYARMKPEAMPLLPVVLYPTEGAGRGQMVYAGASPHEWRQQAIDALGQLQEMAQSHGKTLADMVAPALHTPLSAELGVTVRMSPEQLEQVAHAESVLKRTR